MCETDSYGSQEVPLNNSYGVIEVDKSSRQIIHINNSSIEVDNSSGCHPADLFSYSYN